MGTITNVLLCSFVVGIAQTKMVFEPDMPFLKVQIYHPALLKCCYNINDTSVEFNQIKDGGKISRDSHNRVPPEHAVQGNITELGKWCSTLLFEQVQRNDSGFYQCSLKYMGRTFFSHGTYLQVYSPMEKTINLNESTKNKILTAEGVLLILFVILPSATLLFKTKRLNQLERKNVKKEEENIYQGLNLDDCWSTYDQIERSQVHGPYQDVGNFKEEEEQIQLEKP